MVDPRHRHIRQRHLRPILEGEDGEKSRLPGPPRQPHESRPREQRDAEEADVECRPGARAMLTIGTCWRRAAGISDAGEAAEELQFGSQREDEEDRGESDR